MAMVIKFAILASALAWPVLAPAPVVPGASTSLQRLPDLPAPRAAHSATRLADGRVLFAGGCNAVGCEEGITGDALLFDPSDRTFRATGALVQARVGHRAVALTDGSVLLLGGWTGAGATDRVERFDPATGTFSAHGHLQHARDGFTATPLDDGTILVAGGYAGAMQRMSSAEIYDPRTHSSTSIASMATPRMAHSATRLPDGRVLIAGGSIARGHLTGSLELFDPQVKTFAAAGHLANARHKHAAVVVPGGVLVIGGAGAEEYTTQFADTERWEARMQRVTPGPLMINGRYKIPDALARLSDGDVIVAGSGLVPERLSADGRRFSPVDGRFAEKLSFVTATALGGDRVLIAGGYDSGIRPSKAVWLYRGGPTLRGASAVGSQGVAIETGSAGDRTLTMR